MGEIAEAMLDGTLCEGCGVYIGQDSLGYCSEQCARDRGADWWLELHSDLIVASRPKPRKSRTAPLFHGSGPAPLTLCPKCGKFCRGDRGIADHMRDKHGGETQETS